MTTVRCSLSAPHDAHPWDIEDRTRLRWQCPGVDVQDGGAACPGPTCTSVEDHGGDCGIWMAGRRSDTPVQSPVTRTLSVLEEAQLLIYGERQGDYGPPTDSFQSIAGLWTAYLETKRRMSPTLEVTLDPVDVAHMMLLLKVSRNTTGGYKRDNPVDMAGYAGCIERIVEGK